MAEGGVFNMHFTAIPESSTNKAGGMIVANFLFSPEAQYSKFQPANWGDYPAINLDTLTRRQWDEFAAVDLGDSALGLDELTKAALPEIAAEYIDALEKGWAEKVR